MKPSANICFLSVRNVALVEHISPVSQLCPARQFSPSLPINAVSKLRFKLWFVSPLFQLGPSYPQHSYINAISVTLYTPFLICTHLTHTYISLELLRRGQLWCLHAPRWISQLQVLSLQGILVNSRHVCSCYKLVSLCADVYQLTCLIFPLPVPSSFLSTSATNIPTVFIHHEV
jgi:hypothetical protein